ncbi:hypothetical protein [Vulcanococcus limneticus]|uniref:hypothetical protein n=1 Tax=Vulcanococcus limneticus TaxID=2170428 RepID=UPI00398C0C3D
MDPTPVRRRTRLWRAPWLAGSAALLLGVLAGAGTPGLSASQPPAERLVAGQLGDAVSPSTPEQLALVEHLRSKGAIFYGAWWCPHCFTQKNLFGTEAGRKLPYVECAKDDAGRQRCEAAGIRAFPSWDLNGQRREGVLSLEELKVWSGFPGGPAAQPSGKVPKTPKASR